MSQNDIPAYEQEFIDFIVRKKVITFGEFTTKSGRKTPYFINLGNICNGRDMAKLGEFYADALREKVGDGFDNLFGPAYKGIPLVVATAAALERKYDQSVTFTYNRKEAKDHGEKGVFVGHQYADGDRVVILEDVITAGTSIYESVRMFQAAASIQLKALVVSVDRQERGKTEKSALQEISEAFNIVSTSITSIDRIISYVSTLEVNGKSVLAKEKLERIHEYRRQYGI